MATLEHHPTKRDHPSDKDARQNKELEHDPIRLTDSTRSDHALACFFLILWHVMGGWNVTATPELLALNLLVVHYWFKIGGRLDGPGWSISTEWAANLLVAILAIATLRSPRIHALTFGAGCFALVAFLALRYGGNFQGHIVIGCTHPGDEPRIFSLACTVAEFALGMLVWRLSLVPAVMSVMSLDAITVVTACGIVILLGSPSLDLLSVALFIPLLLGLSRNEDVVARMLGSPVPHWLGVNSFSLYLTHIPVSVVSDDLQRLFLHYHAPLGKVLASVIRYTLPFAIAWGTYRLIERPGQRLCHSMFQRRGFIAA